MTGNKVSELGEAALVERIIARLGTPPPGQTWSGDDAAVIAAPGKTLLFTTDTLVSGVDFDLSYCTGADVGWKALVSSISDVAAMGGEPACAVVSLALSPQTELSVIDGVLDGLIESGARYGTDIVGGDISAGSELVVTVALLGSTPGRVITRGRASPGDVICVTGTLGGSAAGLRILQSGAPRTGMAERFVKRHLRPKARVDEGRKLAELGASSMLDISDGLVMDMSRLMDASGTGCIIESTSIPIEPGLDTLAEMIAGLDPFDLAVMGGEDFELLFTMPPRAMFDAETEISTFAAPVTPIGTVTVGEGGRRLGDSDLERWKEGAWEHLRGR